MTTQEIKVKLTAEGTAQSGAAFQKTAADLNKIGEASARSKAQLQQVQFQITDIVTGLATGQSPFTVLLQQGGQLRDLTGSAFGAVKALASGVSALVTPASIAGAGIATLVAGFVMGRQESNEFRNSLLLTGNAAGITEGKFNSLTEQIASSTPATIGNVREITQALVSTGRFGGPALEAAARAAALLQSATGASAEQIVQDFTRMSQGVAKWAAETNEKYHFLTLEQYKLIATQEELGHSQEAIRLAFEAFEEPLIKQQQSLGLLERAWKRVGQEASTAWNNILAVGRADTVDQQIDKVRKLLEANARRTDLADSIGPNGQRKGATTRGAELQLELANLMRQRRDQQGAADLAALVASQEADAIAKAAKTAKTKLAGTGAFRDELGSFINDQVNAQNRRDEAALERLREQTASLASQLTEQTAQINASLITEDRARGEAQIEIERRTAQARLDILKAGGADTLAAQDALDSNIIARQKLLNEQLKPEWERMVDGWRDATRTMRQTYDEAMTGILRDSEDAFVKLMRTGKLDLKTLSGNLADTMWRGFFRENVGGNVKDGAAKLFEMFGLSRGGAAGGFTPSMPNGWDQEFSKLIGITDKQTETAFTNTTALQVFGKQLDSLGETFGSASSAVVQFLSSLSSGSGSGGGAGGFLKWLDSLFGSGTGGSDGGDGGGGDGGGGGAELAAFKRGGARALGGPVRPGFEYLVGENGPERLRMFHNGGGQVVPMGQRGNAPTVVQHVTNNFAPGMSPAAMAASLEAFATRLRAQILEDAARPGRPLNRAISASR
ncbi:MAG: phage tail length tape measure family protein [Burkholderiaceae bacterium]